MKVVFIEAKRKFSNLKFDFQAKGIEKIGLLATIQFLPMLHEIESELKSRGIKVFKAKTLSHECQIIGCDISAAELIKDKVQAFLLLSSGKWHALMLSRLGKPVFIYNGEKLEKLSENDINKFNVRRKSALMKFLSEDRIGILVSTKPGQFKLKRALSLKEKLEKKGKSAFIFIADTFNISELENFGLKIWVNTACPGIFFDSSSIINIEDIENIEKFK
jgi:2-(3-amino-3-carboxypropyl)histidine synthase